MTARAGLLYPLFFAVFLAGCQHDQRGSISDRMDRVEASEKPMSEFDRLYSVNLSVSTDPDTGCEYLSKAGSNSGITPRMGADGKQICRPVQAKDK